MDADNKGRAVRILSRVAPARASAQASAQRVGTGSSLHRSIVKSDADVLRETGLAGPQGRSEMVEREWWTS